MDKVSDAIVIAGYQVVQKKSRADFLPERVTDGFFHVKPYGGNEGAYTVATQKFQETIASATANIANVLDEMNSDRFQREDPIYQERLGDDLGDYCCRWETTDIQPVPEIYIA